MSRCTHLGRFHSPPLVLFPFSDSGKKKKKMPRADVHLGLQRSSRDLCAICSGEIALIVLIDKASMGDRQRVGRGSE